MGRSVRGEKHYCVIIVIGTDIVRLIREKQSTRFLSSQMATQIELGLEIAGLARQDIENGETAINAFNSLMRQCLGRDAGWKAFYVEQMEKVRPKGANEQVLKLYATELEAEESFTQGDYASASEKLQQLLDSGAASGDDKGWYLQEMARYHYRSNRTESERLQVAAHRSNRFLLKPSSGVTVAKLTIQSQGRMERIAKWVSGFGGYSDLDVSITDILGRLLLGIKADKFESALDELSVALGFVGERPDKEWKEGPATICFPYVVY